MSSTAEWLDQYLQRRHPGQELPYDSDVIWNIRQHVLDLVAVSSNFRSQSYAMSILQGSDTNYPGLWKCKKFVSAVVYAHNTPLQSRASKACYTNLNVPCTNLLLFVQTFPTLNLHVRDYTHTNGR